MMILKANQMRRKAGPFLNRLGNHSAVTFWVKQNVLKLAEEFGCIITALRSWLRNSS